MKAKAGIALGLGLDGGTQDTSDMFANMKAAIGLQRVGCQCAGTFPGLAEVLRLATLGGAEVPGKADLIGSLSPGKHADLILLDPRDTNFAPRWDWLSQIVLNGQPKNVTDISHLPLSHAFHQRFGILRVPEDKGFCGPICSLRGS